MILMSIGGHEHLGHGDEPVTGWQLFTQAWHWEPSVMLGCVLLLGGYLAAVRFRMDRPAILFTIGVVLMLLALVSPLDPLGDEYLFSAHMAQHMLLDMVSPALFVLGLPVLLARRILKWAPARAAERVFGNPIVAWMLGNFTLYVWHLPDLYNASLTSEAVHVFEHATFLVTGTMLWWPVFNPIDERRLQPLTSVVYIALAALANGLLGIILTIPSVPFYSGYEHPKDSLGVLSLIRDTWGIDQLADQQLGGGLMWVGGGIIYLWAVMAIIIRWHSQKTEGGLHEART